MNHQHYPVMNKEVIDIFRETDRKWFIDCTLGMGGHTYHILNTFENSKVMGIDLDEKSLEQAKVNLGEFRDRVEFHRFNFTELFEKVDLSGKEISGILIDPGISMFQLTDHQRGFSHNIDSALDMRKDARSGLTAYDVLNGFSEKELTELFETYGEVRKAGELAKRIIEYRLFNPIDSTLKLKEMVGKLYGWKPRRGKTHPAANVFQALRIVVNKELEGVEEFLAKIPGFLVPKKGTGKRARIVFLTFHSVEDRIVKKAFTALQKEKKLKIIKPFPAFPSEEEIARNQPSRSVKLRAGELL